MAMQLEDRISGETCIKHIRAMQNTCASEEELRHRNCNGYNKECEGYRPARLYQIRIKGMKSYY
jgi:hypothetical protein